MQKRAGRVARGVRPILCLGAQAGPDEETRETPIGAVRIRYAGVRDELCWLWPEAAWPLELCRLRDACRQARGAFVAQCELADAAPGDPALTGKAVAAFAAWRKVERSGWAAYRVWQQAHATEQHDACAEAERGAGGWSATDGSGDQDVRGVARTADR